MKENRTAMRWLAGATVVGALFIGSVAPAQARDTGWNGTVAPANHHPVTKPSFRDTGWNGT